MTMQKYLGSAVLMLLLAMAILFPSIAAASSSGYVNQSQEAEYAEEITSSAAFLLNGEPLSSAKLTDGKTSTKLAVKQGDTLTIAIPKQVGGLYLQFDRPPDRYEVAIGPYRETVESGFLHQWLDMEATTGEITVTLPGNNLCEVSLWSPGNPPSHIQRWQAPYEDCDLLLLPTHADDDQLWFGAAMALSAADGRKVQVAYLTSHWSEPYRPHELLNGLWQSGVKAYPVILDYPDYYSESLEHAKTLYDAESMLADTVSLLRRFRPEVVIGHDLEGEYGHGVHRLNAWLLTQALEQSGDASTFPESAAAFGAYDVQKAYLHLYPEQKLTLDVDTPLKLLGGRTAFQVAQDGYACHVSQQQYWFKVFHDGKYSCRSFGLYRSRVGPDTGMNDMFENITEYSDVPVSSETVSPSSEFLSSAEKGLASDGPEPEGIASEGNAAAEETVPPLQPSSAQTGMANRWLLPVLGVLAAAVIVCGLFLLILCRKTKRKVNRRRKNDL